jgi:glycosyltransferase involved in cell wall biosynthesis
MSDFIKNSLHRWLTRFFLRQCDFVISVSENCREDICSIHPPFSERSRTISIGTHEFEDIQPVPRATEDLIWINIGSFVPEKNHEFLIDAFHSFYQRNQRGYLWLVGDGPMRKSIEEKVGNLKLRERIKFWGSTQQVIPILKSADVMVMPSRIEGMPGVILEALSCKIPVVASAVGGIPEIIENNKTGICISGYDRENYVSAAEKLLMDDSFRNELTRNGFELVNKHYLLPMIANRFEEAYFELTR